MTDQTLSASVEKESEIQRMSLWALNTFASISSLQSEGVAINQEAEKLKNNYGINEAGHEKLNRDGIVSISSATKVLNSIAELSKETIRRKYQDLLSGFDYVLAKHLKSVKEYRENVMKYSDG